MSIERIQKALARQGLGSRRQIETWIKEGRIILNNDVAELGAQVKPGDKIVYQGRTLIITELDNPFPEVLVYNKPEGEVCSRNDPEGRPTIFDRLPKPTQGRWINVGRLDINTSGLILFTNDGELANRLMHPSHQLAREYAVRTMGLASDEMLYQLTHGVMLEDGKARFEDIVDSGGRGTNHWYHVVIMEGRKREVRRLWEAVGLKVSRLKRVRYGPIMLDNRHPVGRIKKLDDKKIVGLAQSVGLEYSIPEPTTLSKLQSLKKKARAAGKTTAKGRAPLKGKPRTRIAKDQSEKKSARTTTRKSAKTSPHSRSKKS